MFYPAGTSAISYHLKMKHPEKLQAIRKDKAVKVSFPPTADSVSGKSTSSLSAEKQLTLSESFERPLL